VGWRRRQRRDGKPDWIAWSAAGYPGLGLEDLTNMSFDFELDRAIRLEAFKWLSMQKAIHGDVLPRGVLEKGFIFNGIPVPIVGPQGIFKPKRLSKIPLSITTTPGGPYDDELRDGAAVIHYRYRGVDRNHHENVGLRFALETQTPLIYCYRVVPGSYVVSF